VKLNAEARNVLLAALFELWLTRSAFDDDRDTHQIPIARVSKESIEVLVAKLGGDRDTALFGAYRDKWVPRPARTRGSSAPPLRHDETTTIDDHAQRV
jgi:hypothetical protein